ncbi:MAG: hypothetical protein HZC25_04180 [Rhodospirillales bacterium]|nr:hypothetical protein [Rhodospirillales bacterium]
MTLHARPVLIQAALLVLLLHGGFVAAGLSPALSGLLADSDGYERLNRVLKLAADGAWYDSRWPLSNAPYGEVLHWTRPLDLVLLLGGRLGSLVAPFDTALYAWGVIISPLLAVLMIPVLSWGTRPYLSDRAFLVLGALLALQGGMHSFFMAARPDHHSLILALAALLLALLLRLLAEPDRPYRALIAGLVGGLAVWVSVESLLPALTFGLGLGLVWMLEGGPYLRLAGRYGFALALASLAALMLERPPGDWSAVEFDRLSILHPLLFALASAGLALMIRLDLASPTRRLAAMAGMALAAGGLALALFPRLAGGFFADTPPEIVRIFDSISEYRPLWPASLADLQGLVEHLGGTLLALASCLLLLRQGSAPEKRMALALAGALLLFAGLAMIQVRWAAHAQILSLLPQTLLAGWLWQRLIRPWRALAVVAILAGPPLLAALLGPPPGGSAFNRPPEPCRWPAMRQALMDVRPPGHVILTHIFPGPALVYGTGTGIVGTPYHRNPQGIADTLAIFADPGDRTARTIIDRRGIDLILVCADSVEGRWLRDRAEGDSLYRRLAEERPPAWMEPVPLERDRVGPFRLYRVRP